MPRRKRRDKPSSSPVAGTAADPRGTTAEPRRDAPPIDPAVALFAQRHQQGIEREKEKQRQRAAEQRKAGEHDRLVAAKDQAVAEMKRINRSPGASQEDRDAADAAYRAATADLIAQETGERPDWAPVVEPDPADLSEAEIAPSEPAAGTGGSDASGEVHGSEAGSDQPKDDQPKEVQPEKDQPGAD